MASQRNKRLEHSVQSLINLYTVVIGAALSIAVASVIDPAIGLSAATPTSICLFVAFTFTLFPFAHGAIRHLDDTYLIGTISGQKGALVIDFILLFFHALAFLVLSLLLKKPCEFAWCLLAVLAIDVLWGVFAYFAASSKQSGSAEFKWMVINLVTVVLSASYLVVNDISLKEISDPVKLAVPVMSVCIIRSLADYILCRDFYFP